MYKAIVLSVASYCGYRYWKMKKVQSEIAKMPGLWRTVWTSLSHTYGVSISQYNDLSINGHHTVNTCKITNYWTMDTSMANQSRGWDWWGDTGVDIEEITGPKTFEEVNNKSI